MFVCSLRANIVFNSLVLMVLLPVEHGIREQEFPSLSGTLLYTLASILFGALDLKQNTSLRANGDVLCVREMSLYHAGCTYQVP